MAGSHIEREARFERAGLTQPECDKVILQLRAKGWPQHKIGRYLGISQAAVSYALDRMAGKKRNRSRYEMCDDCGKNWRSDELDGNGQCPECVGEDPRGAPLPQASKEAPVAKGRRGRKRGWDA